MSYTVRVKLSPSKHARAGMLFKTKQKNVPAENLIVEVEALLEETITHMERADNLFPKTTHEVHVSVWKGAIRKYEWIGDLYANEEASTFTDTYTSMLTDLRNELPDVEPTP